MTVSCFLVLVESPNGPSDAEPLDDRSLCGCYLGDGCHDSVWQETAADRWESPLRGGRTSRMPNSSQFLRTLPAWSQTHLIKIMVFTWKSEEQDMPE